MSFQDSRWTLLFALHTTPKPAFSSSSLLFFSPPYSLSFSFSKQRTEATKKLGTFYLSPFSRDSQHTVIVKSIDSGVRMTWVGNQPAIHL